MNHSSILSVKTAIIRYDLGLTPASFQNSGSQRLSTLWRLWKVASQAHAKDLNGSLGRVRDVAADCQVHHVVLHVCLVGGFAKWQL